MHCVGTLIVSFFFLSLFLCVPYRLEKSTHNKRVTERLFELLWFYVWKRTGFTAMKPRSRFFKGVVKYSEEDNTYRICSIRGFRKEGLRPLKLNVTLSQ